MSIPVDKKLYDKTKKNILLKNPINSSKRSGIVVKSKKKKF